MKRAALLSLLLLCSISRADDIADAQSEFTKLVEYQKTDDDRIVDLFWADCSVEMTKMEGGVQKTRTIPMDAFRRMLLQANSLKTGTRDKYENVKFEKDGDFVWMRATLVDGKSGKRGPFLLKYARGSDGHMKIKHFHAMVGG
jgi:hypothetical protein